MGEETASPSKGGKKTRRMDIHRQGKVYMMGNNNQYPTTYWVEWADKIITTFNLKRHGQEYKGPCPSCGGADRFWINNIDGVVRMPSAFSITRALPPSITATQELVVPRSMPITFDMLYFLSSAGLTRPVKAPVGAPLCDGVKLT